MDSSLSHFFAFVNEKLCSSILRESTGNQRLAVELHCYGSNYLPHVHTGLSLIYMSLAPTISARILIFEPSCK